MIVYLNRPDRKALRHQVAEQIRDTASQMVEHMTIGAGDLDKALACEDDLRCYLHLADTLGLHEDTEPPWGDGDDPDDDVLPMSNPTDLVLAAEIVRDRWQEITDDSTPEFRDTWTSLADRFHIDPREDPV